MNYILALIGLGILIVFADYVYTKWQDNRYPLDVEWDPEEDEDIWQ